MEWLNSPEAHQTAAQVFGVLVIFALAGIRSQLAHIASILSEIQARTPVPREREDCDDWPNRMDIDDARRSDKNEATDSRVA